LAGVDLDRRHTGGANALGVVRGLLIALDHRDRLPVLQIGNGLHQQRGLAGAWARNEVQREHPRPGKARPIDVGQVVILAENIALDLDDTLLAQAGDMHAGKAATVMDRFARGAMGVVVIMVVMMIVIMGMVVTMIMIGGAGPMVVMVAVAAMGMGVGMRMPVAVSVAMAMAPVLIVMVMMVMIMVMRMVWRARLDGGLRIAATAYCTHQATSSSLTRIASPPVICS